jgi:short-subunit dehydrogenase
VKNLVKKLNKLMSKKIIVITGASSGIGKETALLLLNKGHKVYGLARRIEHMQDLEKAGGVAIKTDITDDASIVAAIEKIIAKEGKIDVLVNNAGYAIYGAVEEVSMDDARRQFEVNLFGLARITQLVIPYMRQQNSGKIINISSIGGKIFTPLGAWYHATKFALEGWSDCLRFEVAPFGIDVVVIQPGAIQTEWNEVAMQSEGINGTSAYETIKQKTVTMMTHNYTKANASPALVIAKTIEKAIDAKRPKTRYAAGKWSGLALFGRWILPDRIFDKLLSIQIG